MVFYFNLIIIWDNKLKPKPFMILSNSVILFYAFWIKGIISTIGNS